ncbi:glycosyltransferase family 61 protein [Pontibacter locisalis]|uniref:Glycosyltransferase family 61 protein n=1 Tax=Pontibacter locisalis TaxID=1719035 RepID=A0ABW5IPZ9_9BACT
MVRIKIFLRRRMQLMLNLFLKVYRKKYRPRKVIYGNNSDGISFCSFLVCENDLLPKNILSDIEIIKNRVYIPIYCISNGSINTDNCVSDCFITSKGELINDITYTCGSNTAEGKNNIFSRFEKTKRPKTISGVVFSLLSGGGAYHNYYHWLFESVTRLKILNESPYKEMVDFYVVPNYAASFKKETLSVLNIREEQIIDSKDCPHLKADYVIATGHPNRNILSTAWSSSFLREIFMSENDEKIKPSEQRKIYISRKKASTRRIINEELLFQELEILGFEKVFLEDFPFIDQVYLFSSSSIIVSPHGAGLANLTFAKPNTIVVEIFPPNSESSIYKNISMVQNLNYVKVNGVLKERSDEILNLHSDFIVNVHEILSNIVESAKIDSDLKNY